MLLPGIGVMSWKEVEKRVQWGTLLMFGIGISLGSTLLDTQAASWMANYVVKVWSRWLAIIPLPIPPLLIHHLECQCHCATAACCHPDSC